MSATVFIGAILRTRSPHTSYRHGGASHKAKPDGRSPSRNRLKSMRTMTNELLAKVVCFNITCVIHEMYALGAVLTGDLDAKQGLDAGLGPDPGGHLVEDGVAAREQRDVDAALGDRSRECGSESLGRARDQRPRPVLAREAHRSAPRTRSTS